MSYIGSSDSIKLAADEEHLIIELAKCNLNLSPGKNWIEKEGGLPEYIHSIACALVRGGRTVESAIRIAVSRVRVWAAGGANVNADTRAKAAAAIAKWDEMRAKAKADNVKASNETAIEKIMRLTSKG